jgi:pyruvate-ferredoxin/flavodoxin oxidoreductase
MLARSDLRRSAELLDLAQQDIDERWHYYEQLAGVERALHHPHVPDVDAEALDDETSDQSTDGGSDDA